MTVRDDVGKVLGGRYRLIAPIGSGASARVYLADDTNLRRRVAVKVLHPAFADDDVFLRRFQSEARAAAAMNHPNVVAVYDWGHDEVPYLVTEYLGGGSLRAMLNGGTLLSPSQALLVGLGASRGLEYAHQQGFVHRDIKPANILFGDDGRLRIADFGLARALAEAAWTEPAGGIVGTARYASPEQAKGVALDGKSDVYALALVLNEAVSGDLPFATDTTIGTLMARLETPLVPSDLLLSLKDPVARAATIDPEERLSAGQLSTALMAAAEGLPRPEPLPLVGAVSADVEGLADQRDPTILVASPESTETAEVEQVRPFDDLPPATRPTRRRRWPLVLAGMLVLAALAVGGTVAYLSNRTPTHDVPQVLGLSEQEATNALEALAFVVEVQQTRVNGSVAGEVIAVAPDEGTSLDEGDSVAITVSLGNELVDVPDNLIGTTVEQATPVLEERGLLVGTITDQFDDFVGAGQIISVAAEGQVEFGSAVDLIVSLGPEARVIPDGLAGRTLDEVSAALNQLGLVVAPSSAYDNDVPQGLVISVDPPVGTAVELNSTVSVVISDGPAPITFPNVIGDNALEAVSEIEALGLRVVDVDGPPSGEVTGSDPIAGDTVFPGSQVTLTTR